MEYSDERKLFIDKLSETGVQHPGCNSFYHGRIFKNPPPPPKVSWGSTLPPRNKESPTWLTASEFNDSDKVLEEKAEYLVKLLKCSRKTVVYSGAGISTSSGVKQAARGHTGRTKGWGTKTEAKPSTTHLTLAALVNKGLVQEWVQQNHDGLPQKAGCPQEVLNEIHGSWFDPSNPVVKYSGSLRADLFERMEVSAETADLTIVLGTSLSGLCSDMVAEKTSERSLNSKSLGIVIINLQQTLMDGSATLRIFSETDRLMKILTEMLDIKYKTPDYPDKVTTHALIPYDQEGELSKTVLTCLDLTPCSRIKLNANHNCQGAMQPPKLHIGASEPFKHKGKVKQPGNGVGRVVGFCTRQRGWKLEVDGVPMLLGSWWIEDAVQGGPQTIPIINITTNVQQRGKEGEEYRLKCRCKQQ